MSETSERQGEGEASGKTWSIKAKANNKRRKKRKNVNWKNTTHHSTLYDWKPHNNWNIIDCVLNATFSFFLNNNTNTSELHDSSTLNKLESYPPSPHVS